MKFWMGVRATLWAAIALTCTACGSPAQRVGTQSQPITASTEFADLQRIFLAKYPKATRLVDSDGYFSHTAREFSDLPGAKAAAHDDFVQWCQLKGGVTYLEVTQNSVPVEVRDAAKAVGAMRTVNRMHHGFSWWNTYDEDAPACVVAGKTYLLFSAKDDNGSLMGTRTVYRTVAWLSPEDIATSGSKALQVLAAWRLEHQKQKEVDAGAAEVARQQAKAAEARKISLLDSSAKGTQLACSAQQHSNVDLNNLILSCNGLYITFSEFPQHGWRIASQTFTPLEMNGVPQGRMVDLIAEKVR